MNKIEIHKIIKEIKQLPNNPDIKFTMRGNYLSINKNYLNNTKDETIKLFNYTFSIRKLLENISYVNGDRITYYRWTRSAYKRSTIKYD